VPVNRCMFFSFVFFLLSFILMIDSVICFGHSLPLCSDALLDIVAWMLICGPFFFFRLLP
jgi:hypothetical protein